MVTWLNFVSKIKHNNFFNKVYMVQKSYCVLFFIDILIIDINHCFQCSEFYTYKSLTPTKRDYRQRHQNYTINFNSQVTKSTH